MLKTILPILLFNIVLPFIDIVTDLRIILRLFSGITVCRRVRNDGYKSVANRVRLLIECKRSDLSKFCPEHPDMCKLEKHEKLAFLLFGKFTYHKLIPNT